MVRLKKMIKIDNKIYNCIHFEHGIIEDYEHLHVFIEGELPSGRNKTHIEYEGVLFFGCRIIYTFRKGVSEVVFYIFKKGDKEVG